MSEVMELKLYSPITADCVDDENMDSPYEFGGWEMDGRDLIYYEDTIREALKKEELPEEKGRGLMKYYRAQDCSALEQKVLFAFPDVEVLDGKLYGVLKCAIKEPLNKEELTVLKEYWRGQAADGFGEGFEQRPVRTDSGEMYVHLWQSNDRYFVKTEQELKRDIQAKHVAQKAQTKPGRNER